MNASISEESEISVEKEMPQSQKSTPCDSSDNSSENVSDDEEDEMNTNNLSSIVKLPSTAIDQSTPDCVISETDDAINDFPQENACSAITQYKLVVDNVTPRFQTIERPTVSLNYVNLFAVRDHIQLFHLSRVSRHPPSDISKENLAQAILPSVEDDCCLKNNFSVLVS